MTDDDVTASDTQATGCDIIRCVKSHSLIAITKCFQIAYDGLITPICIFCSCDSDNNRCPLRCRNKLAEIIKTQPLKELS